MRRLHRWYGIALFKGKCHWRQADLLILSYTTWKHSRTEFKGKTILKLLCKLEHFIKPREIVAEIEYSNGIHDLVLESFQIKYQAY